jgi:arginyl-tRNA synthetase
MTIRDHIAQITADALLAAQDSEALPAAATGEVSVERPQKTENGDFASTTPLKLAKPMGMNPFEIAVKLASLIPVEEPVGRIWAARPGFVNFELSPQWLAEQVEVIQTAGDTFGDLSIGAGQTIQVEFVSVNPTGPVHVGHVRGAVAGSALANVLEAAGYSVVREYYFNDTGAQMAKFNLSLLARYKQAHGLDADLPADGYTGGYMVDLAGELLAEVGERFLAMDAEQAAGELGKLGLQRMIDDIRADMVTLRVTYDVWFREASLYAGGQFATATKFLEDRGLLADKDGARWFLSASLGDDQDKVFLRSNGAPTYFAMDVAYHYNKFFERGFDRVIDLLGADHQGHVRFMKTLTAALGVSPDRLDLLVNQMVTLKRGGEAVKVSKRTGDLVTVRELIDEVGVDPCRFFFLSRSLDAQIEFDLELAKEESSENPVYYIQYAHARISSILRLAGERGIDYATGDLSLLRHEAELALIRKMVLLPELIELIARELEPHHLPHYAVELATAFHLFYQQCRVVSSAPEDIDVTRARLRLVEAARVVLARCLSLMIMDAPDEM